MEGMRRDRKPGSARRARNPLPRRAGEPAQLPSCLAGVGMRRPVHCTGLGKAVLAWQPSSFLDELFAVSRLEKLTTHSVTRPSELLAELDGSNAAAMRSTTKR